MPIDPRGLPDARRPLRGRVVLVVGAEESTTRRTALHFAARGASLIVAGIDRHEVLMTAGLGAASGATMRVIEAPSPPLLGAALVEEATRVLERPTDFLISESVVAGAAIAANDLRRCLGGGAFSAVVSQFPTEGVRSFAATTCSAFEAFVAHTRPETLGTP